MNQITLQPTSILPAPMTPTMDLEIRSLSSKLTVEGLGHTIAAEDAPTDDVRGMLQRRVARIDSCLIPSSPRDCATEVMKLFAVLKSRARSDAESELALDLYVEALADVPGFAVASACSDYLKGAAGDREWVPTPPELRILAQTKIWPWAAERARIGDVLRAKVRPLRAAEDRRAEVVAMSMARMKDMRSAGIDAERRRAGRTFEVEHAAPETLEQMAARFAASPVTPSESLLQSMGKRGMRGEG